MKFTTNPTTERIYSMYDHDEINADDLENGWNEIDDGYYTEDMDGDHDSAMDSIGWGDDDSLAYGGGCYDEDY
jgi:hypothetical protein